MKVKKLSYVVRTIKSRRATIYIYAYFKKGAKLKTVKLEDGRRVTGCFLFANRVCSSGRIIHDQQEFNTGRAAWQNILSTGRVLGGLK